MAARSSTARRWPAARALKWAGIVVGVLIGVFLLFAVFMDWNALRGPIARMASAKAGRPIRIDGDLDVRLLTLTPRITVNGLKVGNPRWAGPGSVAEVERLTMQVKLLPLFTGNVVLQLLHIERAKFYLVTDAHGRANWASARTGKPQSGVRPVSRSSSVLRWMARGSRISISSGGCSSTAWRPPTRRPTARMRNRSGWSRSAH
jgi:uncharacterized protein involved in outer membrane biogenesis